MTLSKYHSIRGFALVVAGWQLSLLQSTPSYAKMPFSSPPSVSRTVLTDTHISHPYRCSNWCHEQQSDSSCKSYSPSSPQSATYFSPSSPKCGRRNPSPSPERPPRLLGSCLCSARKVHPGFPVLLSLGGGRARGPGQNIFAGLLQGTASFADRRLNKS